MDELVVEAGVCAELSRGVVPGILAVGILGVVCIPV